MTYHVQILLLVRQPLFDRAALLLTQTSWVLPPLSVGKMTLGLYGALNYSHGLSKGPSFGTGRRRFIETCEGGVICKAVKHGFVRQGQTVRVATTQRIGPEFLDRFRDYAPIPMIFQEEVSKAFDVRVTVVDHKVFAAAIHSQEHSETEVDWRLWDTHDLDLRHEVVKLPSSLEELCRRITRHFDLRYSAIDLIKTGQGDYVFLELNPNGQWAWIEQKAGHPIRDALIDCLGFQDVAAVG